VTRAASALITAGTAAAAVVALAMPAGARTGTAQISPEQAGYPATGVGGRSHVAVPGDQLWVKRYNGPGNGWDQPAGVAVSPDGKAVFVTGSAATTSGADYATVAYRPGSGATLWARHFTGSAKAIAASPTGGTVFVTGNTTGTTGAAIGTIAYDATTGARLWVRRVNDSGATSLAVSPDGKAVFVTGYSNSIGTGCDYATVAYNAATGARL